MSFVVNFYFFFVYLYLNIFFENIWVFVCVFSDDFVDSGVLVFGFNYCDFVFVWKRVWYGYFGGLRVCCMVVRWLLFVVESERGS